MLKIGPYEHASRVIVAPMAGVTDQPFRNVCRKWGTHWLVSEMVTSDRKLWHTAKSANRLRFHDEPSPRWVQIAGGDPEMLAGAAAANVELGAQIIDINMGCPAKKVCNKAAGSALMKDEGLVKSILQAVVSSVNVPVTLKTRLGWSNDQRNAVTIAQIAQDTGVQLVTIHGRSRACKFAGTVDYEAIADVVSAVDIPVIANGDIDSVEKAARVLDATKAAGIMIGRAAQGAPWLPAQVDEYLLSGKIQKTVSESEIKQDLKAHLVQLDHFYGPVMGPRIARKHVGWYVHRLMEASEAKGFLKEFNQLQMVTDQLEAIDEVFKTKIAA